MHHARNATITALALAAARALSGCDAPGEPERIGTFRVTAEMRANTCGAQSMELVPRVSFDVELSLRSGLLRWTPRGASATSGRYDLATGGFRVASEQEVVVVAPNPRREVPGCVLQRTDVIEGVVDWSPADAGVVNVPTFGVDASTRPQARGFAGVESVVWGPTPGSDCRGLLGAAQGQFTTLPCAITYSLSAVTHPAADGGAPSTDAPDAARP